MTKNIYSYRIDWNGIAIEITFDPNWLGGELSKFSCDHLQVRSIAPESMPLPVTGTGYRSQFLPCGTVTEAGGPITYVQEWLNAAAQDCTWRDLEAAARQLSLLWGGAFFPHILAAHENACDRLNCSFSFVQGNSRSHSRGRRGVNRPPAPFADAPVLPVPPSGDRAACLPGVFDRVLNKL